MTTKLDKILEEAVTNIRKDRDKAESLLTDVAIWIGSNPDRHVQVGMTASKYLETLQRSNEQLVKIAAIMKTKLNNEFGDLDKDEKEELYDDLEQAVEEEKDEQEQV